MVLIHDELGHKFPIKYMRIHLHEGNNGEYIHPNNIKDLNLDNVKYYLNDTAGYLEWKEIYLYPINGRREWKYRQEAHMKWF